MTKGVILAGGNGTRLRPLTNVTNKHLLPVYDKPMIYYPIQTLKSMGITDILIVTGGEYIGRFTELLGGGEDVNLTYKVQEQAGGIAHALKLAEDFADGPITVILGDNIFESVPTIQIDDKAVLFAKEVHDPERFGVVEYENNKPSGVVEKPINPPSNDAVVGLYCYPEDVFEKIKTLTPSKRNELEISEVNDMYIKEGRCDVEQVEGYWKDAGTPEALIEASNWAKKFSTD